jgi:hypothetical protein
VKEFVVMLHAARTMVNESPSPRLRPSTPPDRRPASADLDEDIPYAPVSSRPEGGKATHDTQATHDIHETQAVPPHGRESCVSCVTPAALDAIASTQPHEPAQANRRIFDLARRLKGIPDLDDSPAALKEIVAEWFRRAQPEVGMNFHDLWERFQGAWVRVRVPYVDVVGNAFDVACCAPHRSIDGKTELGILAALCWNLSQATGGKPFFLSCRKVGELFDVSRMTASRWFEQLQFHKVIALVRKGSKRGHQATTWRYVADRADCCGAQ